MATTTIPVTVTPEAAERIAELGMQTELDRMVEHALNTLPGLRSLEVQLYLPYDSDEEPGITLLATRANPHLTFDPVDQDWGGWKVRTFTPDICRYFALLSVYEPNHAS